MINMPNSILFSKYNILRVLYSYLKNSKPSFF